MRAPFLPFLLLFTLFIFTTYAAAQVRKPLPDIEAAMNLEYAALKEKFGINKSIPEVVEKQVLFALSYFPELQLAKIKVKIKDSPSGIISTRPTIGSIFRRGNKRSYIIVINHPVKNKTLPLFMEGRVNGQVGIVGHELCHIIYFKNKTGLGLVALGVAHLSKRYMDRFENKTDSANILRGLGYQLIDWKQYLDVKFKALRPTASPPFEKPGERERYMSVEHIRQVMDNCAIYR
jgi:hypothetical protein